MLWFYRNIFSVYLFAVINLSLLEWSAFAVPAAVPTTSQPTTHIVSFVKPRKSRDNVYDLTDFDFETITKNTTILQQSSTEGKQLQKLTQLTELEMISDNSLDMPLTTPNSSSVHNTGTAQTDDQISNSQNTLDNSNEIFGHNDPHETATTNNTDVLHRVKQSIGRSLEPVKHLINTVRDGAFNLTHPQSPHHHLLRGHAARRNEHSGHTEHVSSNDSSAIETEEERESVNESNEFRFLEVLGTIGGMIWQFLMNIQRAFAASSGGASAGLSGGN